MSAPFIYFFGEQYRSGRMTNEGGNNSPWGEVKNLFFFLAKLFILDQTLAVACLTYLCADISGDENMFYFSYIFQPLHCIDVPKQTLGRECFVFFNTEKKLRIKAEFAS